MEPAAIDTRPRSLKMQIRFLRALAFAWWTFGRLLVWYFVMPKLIGQERVERGNMARWVKYARQFRRFAISMGGLMIKLGQFISTRVDILPEEIIKELESLQDEVPSVPYEQIRAVIEQELGAIHGRFQSISESPVAAASLGQVHRAGLLNGEKVVVKVQRPGIRAICYTDMAALRVVAQYAMKFQFIRRRADTNALVAEFNRVVLEELSYEHEAQNAARFAKMFLSDMGVYIPAVYSEHSTDHVITLEDVTAIKVNDYAALEAAGISRKAVASRLMDTYLTQIFEERFFHADPHPGNLFVYPLPAEKDATFGKNGRPFYLIFVDFGMTGTLTENIANGLVNTLTAIVARDAKKLIESYQGLGMLLPDADIDRLEAATKATFDQVWGLSMAQIQNINYSDIAELGREFNDLLYAMPFRLPQDFIYLGRCVGILSGMCTSLDPSYNPWHELQPYARQLVAKGFGVNGSKPLPAEFTLGFPTLLDLFNGNAPHMLFQIGQQLLNRALPVRAEAVLRRIERGELKVQATLDERYYRQLAHIEAQGRRTTRAVLFGSFLITATLLHVSGEVALALAGYMAAGVSLVAMMFGGE